MIGVSKTRGFTMVELLVTLAILGILATMLVPVAQLQIQRAKEAQLRDALREIRRAIDDYKTAADEGRIAKRSGGSGYPQSLQVLVDGVADLRDPKRKLRFLRTIPADPFAVAPNGTDWLLRSYASEASDPRPGEDVYDVVSKAKGIGLNGISYSNW